MSIADPSQRTATVPADNGTPYTFTIKAKNKAGWSAVSPESTAVIAAGKPAPVEPVTAADGDTVSQLTFNPPNDNGDAITLYRVSVNGGASADLGSDKVVRGLTNGSSYTFQVQACNSVSCGDLGAASNSSTPFGNPSAPSVSASVSGTTLYWDWNTPDGNGRPISRFDVYLDGGLVYQGLGTHYERGFGYSETHTVAVYAINSGGRSSSPGSASQRTVDPPTVSGQVFDNFLGGTWARSDPNNGTWYASSSRPSNGSYWLNNNAGVSINCTRYAAGYIVYYSGGSSTWHWWARLTDGNWIPVAATRYGQTANDGAYPGVIQC